MEQFSPNVRYAFQRMWRLGYGTFRGVHVRDGDLVLEPPFRVVRTARFPEAATNRRSTAATVPLNSEHLAFQHELAAIGNGVIDLVKVHDGLIDPPSRVMAAAKWWSDFNPGTGNLNVWHPLPEIVPVDDDARLLLAEARQIAEAEYSSAEARGDPVSTTVWGRVPEQVRKLALLYAVSASHKAPRITAGAVRWATDFMLHQTRRMLFMAHSHVADNPFHAECLKLLRKLREAPGQQLLHSVLLKRMKTDAKTFLELVATLEQQGDVITVTQATAGRPQRAYRLLGGDGEGERTPEGERSPSGEDADGVKEGESWGKKGE